MDNDIEQCCSGEPKLKKSKGKKGKSKSKGKNKCHSCRGTGKLFGKVCPKCHGKMVR